jgi:hypothetical protein
MSLDHLSVHIRQPPLHTIVIKTQPFVIEPQQVQHRRVQIVNSCDILTAW